MTLTAEIGITRGSLSLDVQLALRSGDPATGTFVEPAHRSVGMLFQDYALFAHLSVLENVAFGLRARGMGRGEARREASSILERFDLAGYGADRPGVLSGGQAQRVALARALVTTPKVLLLDEPLAALDVKTRSGVRRDLRELLGKYTGVRLLVTHDPVDAYALADRVVILEAGRVAQEGSLHDVTMHPRSRYVADLLGLNLLRGEMSAGVLTLADGVQVVTAERSASGPTFVTIRPQAVSLHRQQPEGSPRNSWRVTVTEIDRQMDRCRVQLDGQIPVIAEITEEKKMKPREAAVKATEVTAYSA